jgi:putative MFS transporter
MISGGMFIDGFILGAVGILMPGITADLKLSTSWEGLIGASALIGILIGGPMGGLLADRIGRKPMFTIDLAIFLLGSLAQYFVVTPGQLFAVRLVMGIAIGADYAVGWPMLAEFAPAKIRGLLMSVQEIGWYAGYLAAYALAWALTVHFTVDWHFILALSAVPTLIVLLMRFGTPESPRWLMSVGRIDEAEALALEYMHEEERRDLRSTNPDGALSFRHLFAPRYRRATVFTSVFWVCNVTPISPSARSRRSCCTSWDWAMAWPGARAQRHRAARRAGLHGTGRPLGPPPSGHPAVLHFRRRARAGGGARPAQPVRGARGHGVLLLQRRLDRAVQPLSDRSLPDRDPGRGVGFATATSRIGAAAGTFLLPIAMERLGTPPTMLIAAAICVAGGIVSHLLAPETKGLALGEASAPAAPRIDTSQPPAALASAIRRLSQIADQPRGKVAGGARRAHQGGRAGPRPVAIASQPEAGFPERPLILDPDPAILLDETKPAQMVERGAEARAPDDGIDLRLRLVGPDHPGPGHPLERPDGHQIAACAGFLHRGHDHDVADPADRPIGPGRLETRHRPLEQDMAIHLVGQEQRLAQGDPAPARAGQLRP